MNALEFLKSLYKLDEVFKQHDDAKYNERQLIQFAERYHNYKLKLLNSKIIGQNNIVKHWKDCPKCKHKATYGQLITGEWYCWNCNYKGK